MNNSPSWLTSLPALPTPPPFLNVINTYSFATRFARRSFAHFEGEFAARQVLRRIHGLPLRAFSAPPEKCFALALGPRDGFVSLFGYTVFWGRLVPLAKAIVRVGWMSIVDYLPQLPLWMDKKLKVATAEPGAAAAAVV